MHVKSIQPSFKGNKQWNAVDIYAVAPFKTPETVTKRGK